MRRAIVVACATTFACALFPNLSSLSESDGGQATDAADANNASDVALDADGGDATAVTDAGSDASFCATHTGHTFCEDFDEPGFATRWSGVVTSQAGSTAVESDASSASAPNELLTTATFPASTSGQGAFVYKHFTAAKTLKVQVALLVDVSTMAECDPLEISLIPPAGYKTYQIHIDIPTQHLGYTTTPTDGGTSTTTDTAFTTTFPTWRNLEFDLDFTTSAVAVLVDGVPTVAWTVAPLAPTAFDVRLGVVIGLSGTTSATPVVHVDNVLIDTTQ
jgi:hypothetical protein